MSGTPKTPMRAAPSMVDMAAQLRAHLTPLSAHSEHPTPPGSSRFKELRHLDVKRIGIVTTPTRQSKRPSLSHYDQPPATPSFRAPTLPEVTFTPFHDLKQTIDEWIGGLPAEFQGLVESDDEVFVERRETNSGTQLSLFFCSPTKKNKAASSEQLEVEYTPTRAAKLRQTEPHALEVEEVKEVHIQDLSGDEKINLSASSPTTKRHKSLLRKTGRVLKKTIRLLIPQGVIVKHGRRTPAPQLPDEEVQTPKPTGLQSNITTQLPPDESFNLFGSPFLSGADLLRDVSYDHRLRRAQTKHTPQRPSAYPLPTITATEPIALLYRSPEDITSTRRKPVPSRQSISVAAARQLPIRPVSALKLRPQIVSGINFLPSEHGSFYDLLALQAEHALDRAPREVKAAASLSVMAMAAGADFLREDEEAKVRRVGTARKVSGGKAKGVLFPGRKVS